MTSSNEIHKEEMSFQSNMYDSKLIMTDEDTINNLLKSENIPTSNNKGKKCFCEEELPLTDLRTAFDSMADN